MKYLLGFTILLGSFSSNADEYFRFSNIVCLEPAGFFEVSATGIYNIDAYSKDADIVKFIESNSKLVYGKGIIERSCKLSGGLYEVKIEYTKAAESGRCMGRPGASLSLKKDGNLLIDKVSFDWACDWADINRLTINSGEFIYLYGTNYTTASKMKNSFVIDNFAFPKNGSVDNQFISEYSEKQFEILVKK